MKKILFLSATLLTSCAAFTQYTPSFKAFLTPTEVTANAVALGSGHAVLIANGTSKTLTSVAIRLTGVGVDDVVGAWNCADSVAYPNSVICTVGTKILPNDGLSLFTAKRITSGDLGYNVDGVFTRTAVTVR